MRFFIKKSFILGKKNTIISCVIRDFKIKEKMLTKMERNELKNKIEFLKSKWKKFGKIAERKARDNAVILAAGAAATLVPVNMGHNKTDSSNETGNLIERLQNTILSPEKVKIVPEKVISDDNLIEFHNKAQDSKGREIKDFVGATPYSIWDVTYKREVGTQENPVGVFESFAGTMQYNKANVQSMLMYALMHEDYNAWAKQFFEDTPEAKKAVAEMKEAYEEKGNLVFHAGSKERRNLSKFIVRDYKEKFIEDGANNSSEALQVQRDFGSDAYVSFDEKGWQKITSTLAKNNIRSDEVSWAIVGMWCSAHIAQGGFKDVYKTVEGKTLEQINSVQYINELAAKYPNLFKNGSGKYAYKFAKEHYKEPHSITTMRELAMMDQNQDTYQKYLQMLSIFGGKDVTFEEAKLLAQGKTDFKERTYQVSPQMLARAYMSEKTR